MANWRGIIVDFLNFSRVEKRLLATRLADAFTPLQRRGASTFDAHRRVPGRARVARRVGGARASLRRSAVVARRCQARRPVRAGGVRLRVGRVPCARQDARL